MQKRKSQACLIVLLLLGVFCILSVTINSNQAMMSIPLPQIFTGTYCVNGGEPEPLLENTKLSAMDGDVVLKGHFSFGIPEGAILNFYVNHIGYRILVNGELWMENTVMGYGLTSSVCGSVWTQILSPGVTVSDEVEIYLHNPHAFGNKNAYNDFLSTLYNGSFEVMKNYLRPYGRVSRVAGAVTFIVAFLLLGAALASVRLHVLSDGILWKAGGLSFFAGGYMMLSPVDYFHVDGTLAFFTYGNQLCKMFFGLWIGLYIAGYLEKKVKKSSYILLLLMTILDGLLILLSIFHVMVIYDTDPFWTVGQVLFGGFFLAAGGYSLKKVERKKRLPLVSGMLLIVAMAFDMAGFCRSIYYPAICTKVVFFALMILHIFQAARRTILNQQAAVRVEKMEKELEENRIQLLMSQIQPHFLFNVLSSIEELCHRKPELAAKAADQFAKYLRMNLDMLKRTRPVSFSKELEHIKIYLWLEQMRFGDDLHVVYDIETERFELPALSVQPLAENAVRHGLMGREGVCTIEIRTREYEDCYEICVEDDGAGFDPSVKIKDGKSHIGIVNVRSRLESRMGKGASLIVDSEPGKGTKAVIRLPKEVNE